MLIIWLLWNRHLIQWMNLQLPMASGSLRIWVLAVTGHFYWITRPSESISGQHKTLYVSNGILLIGFPNYIGKTTSPLPGTTSFRICFRIPKLLNRDQDTNGCGYNLEVRETNLQCLIKASDIDEPVSNHATLESNPFTSDLAFDAIC